MAFSIPTKLLDRIAEIKDGALAVAMCPNFESGAWRYERLAAHLFDWLPDVALRPAERQAMQHEPYKQLANACRRLFDTGDPQARGELGEILAHAVCRQEFDTVPFVARLFYKMRTNDSVTSVDVVHLLYDQNADEIQLWLGEAKLYTKLSDAKYAALKSIEPLWDSDFLKEMKALIGPKVDVAAPYAERLAWLFADETSLDEIVDRLVVPICIATDFEATVLAEKRTEDYIAKVQGELQDISNYYKERVPAKVSVVCIFVPMDSKSKLEEAVNNRVKAFL